MTAFTLQDVQPSKDISILDAPFKILRQMRSLADSLEMHYDGWMDGDELWF